MITSEVIGGKANSVPLYLRNIKYVQLAFSSIVSPPGLSDSSFAASMSAMSWLVEQGTMNVAASTLDGTPDSCPTVRAVTPSMVIATRPRIDRARLYNVAISTPSQ